MANGNTFVANHDFCYEVAPDGKKLFDYKPPDQGFLIHSIDRRTNGNVVCLSMSGILREVNREGKTVREINVMNSNGGANWCGVQALPANRYLCVEFSQGDVFEFDAEGKVQWKCKIAGASYALRLPNGQTMVCCFSTNRVVHVDRDGKVVWETKVGSQLALGRRLAGACIFPFFPGTPGERVVQGNRIMPPLTPRPLSPEHRGEGEKDGTRAFQ